VIDLYTLFNGLGQWLLIMVAGP